MASLTGKSFDAADETRTPDKTKIDIVRLGAANVARATFQPGWTWADCIKPIAGTDSCQARHFGVAISGALHIVHDDGSEADIGAGDAYGVEPGHNAWVVGDEPFVGYEFESKTVETYAKGS